MQWRRLRDARVSFCTLVYRNSAFVALRGSWNRKKPAGYQGRGRIRSENGKPAALEGFLTGGSRLLSDNNGVLYRVSGAGKESVTATLTPRWGF